MRNTEYMDAVLGLPQQPQQQVALSTQIADMCWLAQRAGLYDAVDWVRRLQPPSNDTRISWEDAS